jgi:ABC-type transport system involved in multi-copper enzyme maturation permease subunit
MLFDTVLVLAAAIIVARNLFTKQGKVGVSLLAIGLSALLTASLTPYYVSFVKLPNQGLATVVYYIITYLLFYVLIAVPAIILSSVIKIAVVGLLLGLTAHLLPTSLSTALTYRSRVYPLMIPLFHWLPPINAQVLGNWLRGLLPGKH